MLVCCLKFDTSSCCLDFRISAGLMQQYAGTCRWKTDHDGFDSIRLPQGQGSAFDHG